MKLVELLARELDVWPEGVVYICQDGEPEGRRIIGFNVKPNGGSYWSSPRGRVWDMSSADKSSDHKTSIITRADWQAGRERIAGKAADEQQQPQQEHEEMTPANTEYNPIHTRNRILEIDRTTEALEEERGQLVQRLADEGFSLMQVVTHGEPVEDMSDWRNWREGDLVESISDESKDISVGGVYRLYSDASFGNLYLVDDGRDHRNRTPSDYKWHSRPTA